MTLPILRLYILSHSHIRPQAFALHIYSLPIYFHTICLPFAPHICILHIPHPTLSISLPFFCAPHIPPNLHLSHIFAPSFRTSHNFALLHIYSLFSTYIRSPYTHSLTPYIRLPHPFPSTYISLTTYTSPHMIRLPPILSRPTYSRPHLFHPLSLTLRNSPQYM
jgi:hypothetical protein